MSSLKKFPLLLVSLLPIVLLVGMLFATIHTFGSDALEGGSQISLLWTTTAFCVFIGITFYRVPWKDYELAITNNISGVATSNYYLADNRCTERCMDDKRHCPYPYILWYANYSS